MTACQGARSALPLHQGWYQLGWCMGLSDPWCAWGACGALLGAGGKCQCRAEQDKGHLYSYVTVVVLLLAAGSCLAAACAAANGPSARRMVDVAPTAHSRSCPAHRDVKQLTLTSQPQLTLGVALST